MKLKTAILCIFALTSKAFANFSTEGWIFHSPTGDKNFPRCGEDLGNPQVNLYDLAKSFSFSVSGQKDLKIIHQPTQNTVRLSLRHRNVSAATWSVSLSTVPKKLGAKKICVPIDFGERVIIPLIEGSTPQEWNRHLKYLSKAQVIIDPGHGGNDWGTMGIYQGQLLREKDLTLEFSNELASKLRKKGIEVALTRNEDTFVALTERQEVANQLKPNLFLSLHLNSKGPSRGFEIFTLSLFKRDQKALFEIEKKSKLAMKSATASKEIISIRSSAKQEASLNWAGQIREVMSAFIPPVKQGVRRAPFFLLYAVDSPALLIELGYMDREEDLKLWAEPQLRSKIFDKMADAIAKTLKE